MYHGLYSEAVVSSVASAVALAEVGQFKEAVQYVQKAAKALYEAAREVFEKVKVSLQRLVELFVEAVVRVLAWIDEHKAYLFLMAAVTAGAITLSAALNLWGLVELDKLAYAAAGAPFVAGLAEVGEKAAERFSAVAERWRVNKDEKKQKIEEVINELINAPLRGETSQSRRPYEALLKLTDQANLPKLHEELGEALAEPLAKLKEAVWYKDEAVQDAAVVAALVLYKTLINNAETYGKWAELYKWARGLVKEREFTVAAGKIRELREAQKRLEEVAEEVRRGLNSVLELYKSHAHDLYEKLKPHLEVDVKKAKELAEAKSGELSNYSKANIGTKAYAALLSIARGGIYGHMAMLFMIKGALADILLSTPVTVYHEAKDIAKSRGETVDPSRAGAKSWEDRAASVLLRYLLGRAVNEDLKFRRVGKGFEVFKAYGGVETRVDTLRMSSAPSSKAGEEELRRLVEEAKRTAPDLTGLDKAPQYVEWCATDATFFRSSIEAATAHPWQLRWYIALFGEPRWTTGETDVTRKGNKPVVTAYWPREREDPILRESWWLTSLLNQQVENWQQLVKVIDWSWVLKKVEELADKLKPWIGPQKWSDAERERWMKRMLGELAHFVHCLARDCVDDRIVRKFVAPALELIMLDKALRGEFDKEKALLIFGEMYATALAGDGSVGRRRVNLVVGGELGGGAALLRLATLLLLKELLLAELKFDVRIYMIEDKRHNNFYYTVSATGENAARFMRLLALSAPSAGGEYLSPKFNQFVEEAKVEMRVDNIREIEGGAAADLIISVGNISIKYNVYLTDYIMLEFESSDRSRVELAARLLKHVGVNAEVKKKEGDRDKWHVRVYTDKLAAGREELRKALIEIVKEAMKRNAVNTNTAERWLEKLEKGRVLMEGWPKFHVRLKDGALVIRFNSTDLDSIEQVAQRLEEMGLKRGVHFTVRIPDNGKIGYVSILTEGLAYAAYLSVRGKNKQQRDLADEFVKLILRRAEEESKDVHEKAEEGKDVYKKALEIVNEGKSWGSIELKKFEMEFEVNGKKYKVKVKGGEAVEEKQNGKTLLRIKIKAEVGRVEDGHTVEREYTITFSRYGAGNKVRSDTYAGGNTPEVREAEAERLSVLIEVLTGKKPTIRRMKDGRIMIICYGGHLEGFKRYDELVETILKWLVETSRR